MRSPLAFAIGLILTMPLCGAWAAEPGYQLGAGDKVRLRVSEWRASQAQVYEWDAVSGDFIVNSAGAISVPLIGEISAVGLSTEKLANAVSDRLSSRVGLVKRPETSIEIVQYRPFYIVGAVNRPGDYPFRPGMTVLQAVGIAGGFYRSTEFRLERENISALGDLKVNALDQNALLARRARLNAELKGDPSIVFPSELVKQASDASIDKFMKQEDVIFQTRRESLRSQTEAFQQVKDLLKSEIKSLRDKLQTQERQLALAQKESASVESLVSKGLAVSARQLSLGQQVAQIETSRLDITMAILRAEQDISKADRDSLELRNRRKDTVATEIKEAEVKYQELIHKSNTTKALVAETEASVPQTQTENLVQLYSVVRRVDGKLAESSASESTAVEPDDVIRVRRAFVPRRDGDKQTSEGLSPSGSVASNPATTNTVKR